jgi:hypothetical protein
MANMTTVLTTMADNGQTRKYRLSTHTVLQPRTVVQSYTPAVNSTASAKDTVDVIYGALDAAGNPIANKVVFGFTLRRPINADATTITNAKALFREFVASDQFDNVVSGQFFIAGS